MNILSIELRPLMRGEPWSWGITSKPIWDYLISQGHSVVRASAEGFFGKQATDKLDNADVVLYQNSDLIRAQSYIPEKSVIRLGGIHQFNVTALKSCQCAIATNAALLDMVHGIGTKCAIIPNGIDLDKWQIIEPPDEFMVGFSCHASRKEEKGFQLVQAACERAGISMRTAIYPDTYLSPADMYGEFYSHISCLVLPSTSEGCSNVVMEALACGIPVILTRVGYHGDTLTDGQNCLFTGRDSNYIAECMYRLQTEPELYESLRNNGRKFAQEHHNHKVVAEKYLSIFESIPKRNVQKVHIAIPKKESTGMKNILLIADREGWAYDNRCKALKQHLSNEFNLDIAYFNQKPAIDYDKYDLIYFAGYMMVGQGRNVPRRKMVTSLAGMVSYTAEEAARYINQTFACSVFNREHYRAVFPHTDTALFYIPNGVDIDLFKPAELPKELVIGWAGNSKHKGKRLNYLQNACKNHNVKLIIQDRDVNYVPHDKMPDFYRQLSCYACVSESEGSNNGVLEAAACGIPIITTPCGNASPIVQDDGGFILKPDLSDLEDKIRLMEWADRDSMSHKLRIRILNGWTWKQRAGQYEEMFQYVLQSQ